MGELRAELGELSSIVCFKALVVGMEETFGKQAAGVALTAAGRQRGRRLVEQLGMAGKRVGLDEAAEKLGKALGAEGTRLCKIEHITEEGERILVTVSETVCMAGEPQGSARHCTFTLGAVHGALEALTGRELKASHARSPCRGDEADIFEFRPRS